MNAENLAELVERVKGHTPGSWAINRRYLSARVWKNGKPEGALVPWFVGPESQLDRKVGGSIDKKHDRDNYFQALCNLESGYRHRSDEEVWANANLIAAAPSLLTLALEQAEEMKRLRAELEQVRGAWVSVEERLPEPVQDRDGDPWLVQTTFFKYPAHGWYFPKGWIGKDHNGWVVEGVNGNVIVTHWRPLPAPPSPSKEGR